MKPQNVDRSYNRTSSLYFPSDIITVTEQTNTKTEFQNRALGPITLSPYGPRQANLVLIAYASSEGSGEPAHPRSLARTSAARSY